MPSPIISATSCARLATPEPIKDWSLTSLKEKLIKIGAKVVSHGRYVAFQIAIRMRLSLAFISPVLAEAAMEGRLPRGFSIKRLTDLPMLWSEQWRAIGLRAPAQVRAEPG